MSIRIRYTCPHCTRRIVHHPELAGHLVICSACKGEFYEPTDPLPGKPAEQALQPRPEATRRLRVPEGNNPRHDLALLARRDASDLRTITEIVEAVLLDDNPPLPEPESELSFTPIEERTINDFGYASGTSAEKGAAMPAIPAWDPPSKPRSVPLATPAPTKPEQKPPGKSPIPGALLSPAGPVSAGIPAAVVARPQRPIPKPAVPVASPNKSASDRPLAGFSVKQMTEELRRRGLGVALVTCEMSPMQNFELTFSDNMTRDDALAVLRKYLETLREVKSTEKAGLLKRIWKKKESE